MTDDPADPASTTGEAERLYAELRRQVDRPTGAELDDLCRAHPTLEADLRALDEEWQRIEMLFPATRSWAVAGEPRPDVPSEVLERLRTRARSVDRYRFQGEVARGGMGAILRVWDQDLHRALAMKVVLGHAPDGTPTPQAPTGPRVLGRFLDEAQVTGQLDHPGIVPVHELGVDDEGRAYFTMRLVRGRDLRRVFELACEGVDGWSRTRVLGVLLKVCEAMAYAHSKGVIHRDLKPANVMVGRFGEVYVMDWGLARVLERDSADEDPNDGVDDGRDEASAAPRTRDGDVIGTPSYMAPEQARGSLAEVDARSDVYALGAMLYHLVAGRPPHVLPGETPSHAVVLQRVVAGAPRALHDIDRDVPAELAAICDKAMAREPAQRYADIVSLEGDLRSYLENRVVKAYRTGALVELQKWVRRNRALAAALLIVFVGSLGFAVYERRTRNILAKTAAELSDQKGVAEENEAAARRSEKLAIEARRNADGARLLTLASDVHERDPLVGLLLAVEGARRRPGPDANDLLLRALVASGLVLALDGHSGAVNTMTFSGDGTLMVTGGSDATLAVWNLRSGERLRVLRGHRGAVVAAVHQPGGEVVASLSDDRRVLVWNVVEGRRLAQPVLRDWPLQARFEANGDLTLCTPRGFRRSWNPLTGAEVPAAPPPIAGIRLPALAASGVLAVVREEGQPARAVDAPGGGARFALPPSAHAPDHVAIAPDSSRIATVSGTSAVHVFDAATGELVHALESYDQAFHHAAFSPDGQWIFAASFGAFSVHRERARSGATAAPIHVWNARTGHRVLRVDPWDSGAGFSCVAFTPDSAHLVVAERGQPVRVLPVSPLEHAERRLPRGLTPFERARYGVPDDDATGVPR